MPESKRWTEPQQLAFLINAYHGYTFQLIIDQHPVKSIKDIGGLLKGPWINRWCGCSVEL